MCLLVLQTEKTKMKKASFYEAHKSNADGIGLLIRTPNKEIKVFKFMDINLAWDKYNNIKDDEYDLISIHFRLATSGGVNYEMMHPFNLGTKNGGWLLHNGVIADNVIPKIEGMSDTASLAEYIKQSDFTEKQLYSYPIRWFLHNVCGAYNKFLIISPNKYELYNEKAGHWRDGIWYSNHTYKIYNTSYKEIEEDDECIEKWLK